jgi:hypothetical protein
VFFQTSVKFLGHIVSENGVSTDPEKTRAVQDWDRPSTQKRMRGFLGLSSYHRNYVKNFAQIARPLHKLCEKAFNILKVSTLMLQITIGQGSVSVVVYFPQRLPLGLLCHPDIIDTLRTVVL